MSLIIKGMEMPKDRPVCVYIWPDGRVSPTGLYKASEWDGVKATYLPKGHGRLGDLDALKTGLFVFDEITRNYYINRKEIENAFTIVPAEGGGENGD